MTRSLNVFLVEDSAQVREALTHTIQSYQNMNVIGYADNSDRAIHSLETLVIDALIIDLNLREGSGLHVLSYLKRNGNPRSVLRIVLTSHATPVFRRACEAMGAEYVFDKSLEIDRAMEALKMHLASIGSRVTVH